MRSSEYPCVTYVPAHVSPMSPVHTFPKRPSSEQKRSLSLAEIASEPMHICSDAKYRCVYGLFRVFAVPRKGLTKVSTYSAGGAEFRIQRCLRAAGEHCQVALISSDCQEHSGTDGCQQVEGGRQRSSAPGPVLYFIYNEDFGVISYGSVEEPLQTQSSQTAAASKWILHGARGLLAD
jgi:hypothetical protein